MVSVIPLTLCALLTASPAVSSPTDSTPPAEKEITAVTEPEPSVDPTVAGWHSSIQEAQRLAAAHKLPLLLHFEAEWCGPCRRMESEVLNEHAVLQHFGKSVIALRIDADRSPDIVKDYAVTTLPTEILLGVDGSELKRHVGAVDLDGYLSRLNSINVPDEAERDAAIASSDEERECLIVQHDGRSLGLGGFSPVALTQTKEWREGKAEFCAQFQGVDYFLASEKELAAFESEPAKYVPSLHGCDPVLLTLGQEFTPGKMELGVYYEGKLYFFTSTFSRDQFRRNPQRYQPEESDSAFEISPLSLLQSAI